MSSLRIIDYLEQVPGVTKNLLYKQPSTVLAVFRRMQSHLGMKVVVNPGCRIANLRSEEYCHGSSIPSTTYPCRTH